MIDRNLPDELEIQRGLIILRENWAAEILYFMGREDDAPRSTALGVSIAGSRARETGFVKADTPAPRTSTRLYSPSPAPTHINRSDRYQPNDHQIAIAKGGKITK